MRNIIYQFTILGIIFILFGACERSGEILPNESDLYLPKIRSLNVTTDLPNGGSANYTFDYNGDFLHVISKNGYPVTTISYDPIENRARIASAPAPGDIDSAIAFVKYHRASTSNIFYMDSIYTIDRLTGNTILIYDYYQNRGNSNKLSRSNTDFAITKKQLFSPLYVGASSNISNYNGTLSNSLSILNFDTANVYYTTIANQANLPFQFVTNSFWQYNYGLMDLDLPFLMQQSNIFPYRAHDNLIQNHIIPMHNGSFTSPAVEYQPHNFSYTFDASNRVNDMTIEIYGLAYNYQIIY